MSSEARLRSEILWCELRLRLASEGGASGPQVVQEIVDSLRPAMSEVAPAEVIWMMRTMSPLVVESLKNASLWPTSTVE